MEVKNGNMKRKLRMENKQIRFTNKNQAEFIKDLREQVKEYFDKNKLSKYGNASIVTKSVLMLSLYLVPFILMLTGTITNLPIYLLSWVLIGLGMAGLGMVLMHDANHMTYSKNHKINKFLSYSLYLLGGFPFTWQHQHNTLHHGFTNLDGHDEDISGAGFMRFSPNVPIKKHHKFQHFYAWFFYGLMTISWSTAKDFRQLRKYQKEHVPLSNSVTYRKMYIQLIISKLLYYVIFLILPLILVPFAWYWTVLGYLTMHFICGFSLSVIFQTAHVMPSSEYPIPDADGKLENSWAIHQLLNTSNYSPKSRIFSWFIGGLNYQVEHHLFPYVSHVHYKKLSVLVKATAKKYKLPYHVQDNFISAVYSHFKMLKMLGR